MINLLIQIRFMLTASQGNLKAAENFLSGLCITGNAGHAVKLIRNMEVGGFLAIFEFLTFIRGQPRDNMHRGNRCTL